MKQASEAKAKLIHFGESALSGYCGPDFESWSNYDWELLRQVTVEIMQAAKAMNLWSC